MNNNKRCRVKLIVEISSNRWKIIIKFHVAVSCGFVRCLMSKRCYEAEKVFRVWFTRRRTNSPDRNISWPFQISFRFEISLTKENISSRYLSHCIQIFSVKSEERETGPIGQVIISCLVDELLRFHPEFYLVLGFLGCFSSGVASGQEKSSQCLVDCWISKIDPQAPPLPHLNLKSL